MLKLLLRKFIKFSLFIPIVVAFLILGNIYTYERLTDEKPIAKLNFIPINGQEFDAIIRIGEFCEEKTYRLYGDEWRIDAQFLKWKSWATLFGADAVYRIDRISGRYTNIDDENSKQQLAHELNSRSVLNLSELAARYNNKFPPVDTVYGSSAYAKMQIDILFTVYRTQSGILIREQALSEFDQSSDCATESSAWKNTIVKIDQKLAALIY